MTQKTVTRRVCDRHKDRDGFPVPITIGVHTGTTDLCYSCQEELLAAVHPFLEAARPTTGTANPSRRRVNPPRTVPYLVREWGRANGIEVPERGRIPRFIEDQYLAAKG